MRTKPEASAISTASYDEVENYRAAAFKGSPANQFISRQLDALREYLVHNKLDNPIKVDFKDLPVGKDIKPNPKNALNKFRRLAAKYIASQDLQVEWVTGQEGNRRVLFIVNAGQKKRRAA